MASIAPTGDRCGLVVWMQITETGRKAIEDDFADLFTQAKGLTLRIEIASVRFPTADTAIEDGATSVMLPDGSLPNRARYTNFFVKKDGKWKVASFHASTDLFDNPVLHIAVRRTAMWTGGIAGVAGLAIGCAVGIWHHRPEYWAVWEAASP